MMMDYEGNLELSLGCLRSVVTRKEREHLSFPLILQVLECVDCRSRSRSDVGSSSQLCKMITVSDGFYRRTDCFIITANDPIPVYSIIRIVNVDFDSNIERGHHKPKIVGVILEYNVLVSGSDIGFLSGNPSTLDSRTAADHRELRLSKDSLSQKLWKQVKAGRCCDIVFVFPLVAGQPTLQAQRSALVANSDVFAAQFEGDFSDSCGRVEIEDSEPKYMRCLLQYIYTRFVPLLSLNQAFELLYLARKYIIKDLESYCRTFIMKNGKGLAGVTNVFQYLEMNSKSMDDEIQNFVLKEFEREASVLIRQPQFNELDLATLETFLAMDSLNAHEWELLQALRRWCTANDRRVSCKEQAPTDTNSDECLHQLLDCIRWKTVPLKEAILANCWPEFKLGEDPEFLSQISELHNRGSLEYEYVIPNIINRSYSLNRKYDSSTSFMIYTSLILDLGRWTAECMHGHSTGSQAKKMSNCSTIGPPFELQSYLIIPSYGIKSAKGCKVKILINLLAKGDSKQEFSELRHDFISSRAIFKVFSFSNQMTALEKKVTLNFYKDRYSCNTVTFTLTKSDLQQHYLHTADNGKQWLDIQIWFCSREDIRGSPERLLPRVMPTSKESQSKSDSRKTTTAKNLLWFRKMSYFPFVEDPLYPEEHQCGDETPPLSLSPVNVAYRYQTTHRSPSQQDVLEVQSPGYDNQPMAYGDVTRSPQSPRYHSSPHPPSSPGSGPSRSNPRRSPSYTDSYAFSPSRRGHSPPYSYSCPPAGSPYHQHHSAAYSPEFRTPSMSDVSDRSIEQREYEEEEAEPDGYEAETGEDEVEEDDEVEMGYDAAAGIAFKAEPSSPDSEANNSHGETPDDEAGEEERPDPSYESRAYPTPHHPREFSHTQRKRMRVGDLTTGHGSHLSPQVIDIDADERDHEDHNDSVVEVHNHTGETADQGQDSDVEPGPSWASGSMSRRRTREMDEEEEDEDY